jgi:transcription initiation factor TFIIIB Brf1 subunit/transcription initiation factor TFIIB
MNGFELPDDAAMTAHAEAAMQPNITHKNMCPDCDVPMAVDVAEFRCPVCMRSESADITVADATNSTKRNWSADPTRSQRQSTLRSLENRAREHTGDAIPHDILEEVSDIYLKIQTGATEEEVIDGEVVTKKFVRRGNNKDQILAYLIYVTCLRKGVIRSKPCIAQFMGLKSQGFSQGEKAVRLFQAQGIIKGVCFDDEPIEGFIARYFDILRIDITYSEFVRDLVDLSIRKRIGMTSKPTSKIVGAMWMLVTTAKLKISVADLEKATETKKATFMNFYEDVRTNISIFKLVFQKHGLVSI